MSADATGSEAPKTSLMTGLIIPLVAATVVAGGAGLLFGLQISDLVAPKGVETASAKDDHGTDSHAKGGHGKEAKDGHGKKDAHAKDAVPKTSKPLELTVVPITQILTAMAGTKAPWVRVEAVVVFEGPAAPEFNAVAQKIGEDIVAYLKVTSVDQIEGASGFQYLREDINERARIRGQGKVREVIVQSLLIE